MERRNPADDRLDSLKSTQRLLSSLKRKRDDEEKDLGPREGESGEDYKARVMETMREAMESCSEALRIRDERVAEKIEGRDHEWPRPLRGPPHGPARGAPRLGLLGLT